MAPPAADPTRAAPRLDTHPPLFPAVRAQRSGAVTRLGPRGVGGGWLDSVAGLFGELSRFHETWGAYADPVDIRTGRFPSGWLDRLIPVPVDDPARSRTYLARCAELHDLVVAKLVAGRDKDRAMITDLERHSATTRLAAWTARRG